ncbi:MAG: hypothetical protein ACLP4W_09875 [Mycobacterium sp.]|uniref:hypothetical protein n=1 Tax=Mycobacterium sp. TaxID=1785 RepID=UPI003F9ABC0B
MTIVGGGISVAGSTPNTGLTAPFAVVAVVTFDPAFVGESPAVELLLEDRNGQPIALPGAVGPLGQPQYMRVGVSNQLQPTVVPNQQIPTDVTRPKVQILLNFQTGLPLTAGQRYTWRVRIDGISRDEWTEWLYIPSPAPGAVVG